MSKYKHFWPSEIEHEVRTWKMKWNLDSDILHAVAMLTAKITAEFFYGSLWRVLYDEAVNYQLFISKEASEWFKKGPPSEEAQEIAEEVVEEVEKE